MRGLTWRPSPSAPGAVLLRPAMPLLCCTSASPLPAAGPLQHTLRQDQKIVLLEHNTTIGDALKTLAKHNILSAPMASGQGVGCKTEGRCRRAGLAGVRALSMCCQMHEFARSAQYG